MAKEFAKNAAYNLLKKLLPDSDINPIGVRSAHTYVNETYAITIEISNLVLCDITMNGFKESAGRAAKEFKIQDPDMEEKVQSYLFSEMTSLAMYKTLATKDE